MQLGRRRRRGGGEEEGVSWSALILYSVVRFISEQHHWIYIILYHELNPNTAVSAQNNISHLGYSFGNLQVSTVKLYGLLSKCKN